MPRLAFTPSRLLPLLLPMLLPMVGATGCTPDENPSPRAVAEVTPLMDSGVSGTIHFTVLDGGGVRVEADISGLTPGDHGIHVHEWGDCTAPDGESAGSHFNPDMVEHGQPGGAVHHPGDFGNLKAGDDGRARLDLVIDAGHLSLTGGPDNIVGRSIIIHEKPDDFSQPTGNAGGRLACGIIMSADGDTTPILNPAKPGA